MESIHTSLGDISFIKPVVLEDFDSIISQVDFKCNDFTKESFKEYLKGLSKDDDTDDWKIFLAVLNNKTIGITGWYTFKDSLNVSWLTWFGVIEKYQKGHIGSSILKHTINTIKGSGKDMLYVYCIDGVVPFYKKNGFKHLGKAGALGLSNKCENDSDNILVLDFLKD